MRMKAKIFVNIYQKNQQDEKTLKITKNSLYYLFIIYFNNL